MDSGEAIVFAYPQGVELDGPLGLSQGRNPLLEKKKNKYRLRDYSERGSDEKIGASRHTDHRCSAYNSMAIRKGCITHF